MNHVKGEEDLLGKGDIDAIKKFDIEHECNEGIDSNASGSNSHKLARFDNEM